MPRNNLSLRCTNTSALFILACALFVMALLLSRHAHAEATAFTSGIYGGIQVSDRKMHSDWNTSSAYWNSSATTLPLDSSAHTSINNSYATGNGVLPLTSGMFGYNYVTGQYLLGLEGQIKTSKETTTISGIPGCTIECVSGTPGPATDTSSVSLGGSMSLLARLGWLPQPDILLYVLGGVTRQYVSSSSTCQGALSDPICWSTTGNPYYSSGASANVMGKVLGIGAEKKFDTFSVRLDLKYTRLNTFNTVANFHDPSNLSVSYGNKINFYDLSLGVLYHF